MAVAIHQSSPVAHLLLVLMDALIDSSVPVDDEDAGDDAAWRNTACSVLKPDPGRVSLKSVLRELETLRQIEGLQLPNDLFNELHPNILRQYRLCAAAEPPREVRLHPEPIRYTLLATFCWQRRQEIIDGLTVANSTSPLMARSPLKGLFRRISGNL